MAKQRSTRTTERQAFVAYINSFGMDRIIPTLPAGETAEGWEARLRAGEPCQYLCEDQWVWVDDSKGATSKPAARVQEPQDKREMAEALAYIASYTGKFGLILDLRADRRFGTKYMSLSPRQTAAVLASKAREAVWAAQRQAAAPVAAPVASVAAPVTEGFYSVDGTIFKVQRAVNGSGHLYAKILDPDTGSFEYAPGAIKRLSAEQRLTQDQAVAFGRLYGRCAICGRTLTDENSIAQGIGPVCIRQVA